VTNRPTSLFIRYEDIKVRTIFYFLKKYDQFLLWADCFDKTPLKSLKKNLLNSLNFLPKYYLLNDLLWQEGFLIDFVQKKTTDKFVRKFLITSAYLFSERLLFDKLIRVYSDLVVLLTNKKSVYEYTSVAGVIMSLVLIISLFILLPTILFFISGNFEINMNSTIPTLIQLLAHCDVSTLWFTLRYYSTGSIEESVVSGF